MNFQNSSPRVSVIMPVYNGEKFLKQAINSILEQTYRDFELIIVNDASVDKTSEIIDSYNDKRIRVITNHKNLGLIDSLNMGITAVQGEFIARMDQDDISLPKRFERQLKFLFENSDIGLCGSWVELIDEDNNLISTWRYETDPASIKCSMLLNSCLVHPSVMFRKSIINKHNLRYQNEYIHAEDYAFFYKLSQYCKLANLPEILLQYRIHQSKTGNVYNLKQTDSANLIRKLQLNKLGVNLNDYEYSIFEKLCYFNKNVPEDHLIDIIDILSRILIKNETLKLYPQKKLKKIFFERINFLVTNSKFVGLKIFFIFYFSKIKMSSLKDSIIYLKLFLKCVCNRRDNCYLA